MTWIVVSVCSAAADVRDYFSVDRALLNSLTCCTRDPLVWPMYALMF